MQYLGSVDLASSRHYLFQYSKDSHLMKHLSLKRSQLKIFLVGFSADSE